MSDSPASQPIFQVRSAVCFRGGSLLIFSLFGVLLLIPAVIAIGFVSLHGFGISTGVWPLLALIGATFFLPFGFGNPYLKRVAARYRPGNPQAVLVQLSCEPRVHTGIRGLVEDADDFGWISTTAEGLRFDGDSLSITLPVSSIGNVRIENSGPRGLFLYQRITLEVRDSPKCRILRVAERSSLTWLESRQNTRQLYRAISAALETKKAFTNT